MSATSIVAGLVGIRSAVVGDNDGQVLENHQGGAESETVAAVSAMIAGPLNATGDLLGLGSCAVVSIKADGASRVIAFQAGVTMSVETEPNRAAGPIETILRANPWAEQIEEIDDQIVLMSEPPTPPPPPPPPFNETATKPVLFPMKVNQVPRPRPSEESWVNDALMLSKVSSSSALRKALIAGHLSRAEALAEKLTEALTKQKPANDPFLSVESQQAIRPLIEGIGAILAGDNLGGLRLFKSVSDNERTAAPLRWVKQVWSARALVSSGDSPEAALAFAQKAEAIAQGLDTEAQAVSLVLAAELAHLRNDQDTALTHLTAARHSFNSMADRPEQEIAACWFLEARVFLAMRKNAESIRSAEQANKTRPSWPPPVIFMATQALRTDQLQDAERVLLPLLSKQPIAAETERTRRLLEYVRAVSIPSSAAYEYLKLQEAPPSHHTILGLDSLSRSHPHVMLFRESLGWKLLRAGDYERAAEVFDSLSERTDLSDEEKSSILLALGMLAAVDSRHSTIGARLRATVSATPANLQGSEHPRPPSVTPPNQSPLDFWDLESPPESMRSNFSNEEPATSPRMVRVGPVFAGDLQLFALPDLLEFLRSGQRTGTLVCSSVAGIGALHIRRGMVTGAASPNTKWLGDYLVARGAIALAQLPKETAEDQGKHTLVGSRFVNEGIVTAEQVRGALMAQIKDALLELIGWGEGQFAFDPEATVEPAAKDVDVSMDPQGMLLDIFREIDERANNSL